MIMALNIGNSNATTGMTKSIYDKIRQVMEPMENVEEPDMEPIREGWRNLSFAVASGVIEHLIANLEIAGIETQGSINAEVDGNTETANGHNHPVSLNATQNNVLFLQNNDGPGLVR